MTPFPSSASLKAIFFIRRVHHFIHFAKLFFKFGVVIFALTDYFCKEVKRFLPRGPTGAASGFHSMEQNNTATRASYSVTSKEDEEKKRKKQPSKVHKKGTK